MQISACCVFDHSSESAVIQLFSFWTPSEHLVNPSLPGLETNENNMILFPGMPDMLDAQPPFSAELSWASLQEHNQL